MKGLIHPAVARDDDAASRIRIKNSRCCMTHPELHKVHSMCSRAGTRHCEQSKVIAVARAERAVKVTLSPGTISCRTRETDHTRDALQARNAANLGASRLPSGSEWQPQARSRRLGVAPCKDCGLSAQWLFFVICQGTGVTQIRATSKWDHYRGGRHCKIPGLTH